MDEAKKSHPAFHRISCDLCGARQGERCLWDCLSQYPLDHDDHLNRGEGVE